MSAGRTAFHDLPAAAFPLVIEFIRVDTGETVQVIDVEGPGVTAIPALAPRLGVGIAVRISFADGGGATYWPDPPPVSCQIQRVACSRQLAVFGNMSLWGNVHADTGREDFPATVERVLASTSSTPLRFRP